MRRIASLLLLVAACGSRDGDPHARRRTDRAIKVLPPPPPAHPTSNLPEAGADPDYPTPRRAGTDKLFVSEAPDRGPHVTHVAVPPRRGLTETMHATCDVDEATVVCSKAAPGRGDAGWRLGVAGGKPRLLEWVRPNGHVDETVVLDYDGDGHIHQMAELDAHGTIAWVRSYSRGGLRYTQRQLSGANALPGCGAVDLEVDASGRAMSWTCLQWGGDPMRDTNGVVTTRYTRDREGFVITEERFDASGVAMAGIRDGVFTEVTLRDRTESTIGERYYDLATQPVGSRDEDGCAGVDMVYVHNQMVKDTCLGTDGAPTARDDGVTITEHKFDASGCSIGERHEDAGGEPTPDELGIAEVKLQHDAACDEEVYACYGTEGQRVPCGPGEPAAYLEKFDAHGDMIDQRFLDENGEPGLAFDYRVPDVQYEYDELGRAIATTCRDGDGALTECAGMGYAREADVYDDAGHMIESRFFDENGEPALNMGTAVRISLYDNYDHLIEQREEDATGQLQESHGMAIQRRYYDESHRLFGLALLDKDGKAARYDACFSGITCPPTGTAWHAVRILYGPGGREVANEYFDDQGQKVGRIDCKVDQCW